MSKESDSFIKRTQNYLADQFKVADANFDESKASIADCTRSAVMDINKLKDMVIPTVKNGG